MKTFGEMCFWKCGVDAHVRDGKVVKLTGQKDHPLSNGRLCPRGAGGLGLLYDPDRLAHPLIRETIKGKQQFRKASWDEAMTVVGENVKKIGQEFGPGSLVSFTPRIRCFLFQASLQFMRYYRGSIICSVQRSPRGRL